ncbi:MarC family protein [Dokdonella sp.]|uniref:MarC family protein n=1 Tax=Dokdonella sp. TaxID=2291710 RepID=UPI003C4B71D1
MQAIVTILSLVNPAVCATMFAQATSGQSFAERFSAASKASVAVLVILVIAALAGTRLLGMFGISLDAFMVAGGGVLAWMGFSMLAAKPAATDTKASASLTPLILFAASPGTITGVITLSAAQTRSELPLHSLVAITVAAAVLWLVLLAVSRLSKAQGGESFLKDTMTRFMGLIVLAMGVQFALTGYRSFMAQ